MDGTVTNLDSALDAQIEVMRAWVAVAQREQQHLLAVEPEGINACVREREALTRAMAEAIQSVHHTVADLRAHFGIGREEDVTVSTLARHFDALTIADRTGAAAARMVCRKIIPRGTANVGRLPWYLEAAYAL